MIISCDAGGCDKERLLDVNAPDVEVLYVNQTNSLYKYIDTKQFFFAKQKAVLTLFSDNTIFPFPMEAAIHVFPRNDSLKRIKRWVFNQHSDDIYGDAAQPFYEAPLSIDLIKITKYGIHGGR